MASAALRPSSIPRVFAGPSGTLASDSPSVMFPFFQFALAEKTELKRLDGQRQPLRLLAMHLFEARSQEHTIDIADRLH